MKTLAWAVIIIVAVAVVAGFFMVGSPREERARQFDNRRVQDLQTTQRQIIYYWQRKNALPPNLDALNDDISGFRYPHDPETGLEYEYTLADKESFRLCATFSRPSGNMIMRPAIPGGPPSMGSMMEVWWHSEGRYCFDRRIDKELYPPLKEQKTIK